MKIAVVIPKFGLMGGEEIPKSVLRTDYKRLFCIL